MMAEGKWLPPLKMVRVSEARCDNGLHAKDNSPTKFQDEVISDYGESIINNKISGIYRVVRELAIPNLP